MRRMKLRVAVVLAATLAATAGGGAAGFLLARTVVLRVAADRLVSEATRSLEAADTRAADARSALAAMKASPYRYCSDSELTYFRHILFHWRYPREGGRMADGHIACSTTLGRNKLPQERFKPIYSEGSGFQVYWNPAPFRTDNEATSVLQTGTSYVDVATQIQSEGLPPGASLQLTLLDPHGQPVNPPIAGDGKAFITNGYRRMGGMLYATRCSARYPHCVTAAISAVDAFRMGRPIFATCMALMGLASGVLGFFVALGFCRNWTREQQLNRAVRRDELCLAYQPVVDLASGRIVGAEALTRWTDEEGLAVAPDVFIPLAEKEGFVGEITRLVLRHVLRDLGSLLCSDPSFQVSMNVTAWDLAEAEFVPMVEATLAQAGVRPESVTIEITETSTARNERAIKTIRQLRAAGHRVHIDDFGTGYSSLAYLQDLSVDAIKIDKVFTQAIGTGSVTVSLLPQILAMADALNLEIVVEGIESKVQAQYFAAADKRIRAQGWLYGKPVPVSDFLEMLAADRETLNPMVMRDGYGQDWRCSPSPAPATT